MPVIRLNPSLEDVVKIRKELTERSGFCPSVGGNSPASRCMCKEFKAQIADPSFEDYCRCHLFYKEKEAKSA